MSDELREKCKKFLKDSHDRIMGDYDGDPWAEHPYQDSNKPYFWDDEAKELEAFVNQALTAYRKELLSKAIPVAALRVKDKEFEQIQAIPLSAIQEDEVKDA